MTKLVVLGPNLIDQSKGDFHVHAAGCSDLATYYGRQHADDKANVLDFNSEEEVAKYVYADMLDDNDVSDLLNGFYFFPCVTFPKEKETMIHKPAPEFVPQGHVVIPGAGLSIPAAKSYRVTFELYNDELFFEMVIITTAARLSATVALLESVPNVRQVNVTRES